MRQGEAGRTLVRNFECVHVPLEGRPGTRMANRITCGCGATAISGGSKLIPPEGAIRYFRNHGWTVGNKPKHDMCPSCSSKKPERKPPTLALVPTEPVIDAEGIIHHDMELIDMQKVHTMGQGKTVATLAEARALPPKAMGIDDRRIVYEAIGDHYVDPKTGYEKGWDDRRISDHLGVPRAWVTEVREALFGPEQNAELVAIIADQSKLREELTVLDREIQRLQGEKSAFEGRLANLQARISRFEV